MLRIIFLQNVLCCLLICLGCGSATGDPGDDPGDDSSDDTGSDTETPLKELAADHSLLIGSNYDYALADATHDTVFEEEFNVMTAGIFWGDGSRPSRTEYDFSEMDAKVNWGRARGMDVLGQTLVWFSPSELPDWFKAAPNS